MSALQRDPELQKLIDRQEIYDCMIRYCRGVDRLDAELVRSAYHPDGIDDHGGYVGPRDSFVKWGQNVCATLWDACMHVIGNHSCEIEGNRAHTETYYIHIAICKDGSREIRAGRYIQQYEKRNGRWGIIESICTMDCDQPELDASADGMGIGKGVFHPVHRNHSDPSYARPLVVDRNRFTKDLIETLVGA